MIFSRLRTTRKIRLVTYLLASLRVEKIFKKDVRRSLKDIKYLLLYYVEINTYYNLENVLHNDG